jgi:hypothetical protein
VHIRFPKRKLLNGRRTDASTQKLMQKRAVAPALAAMDPELGGVADGVADETDAAYHEPLVVEPHSTVSLGWDGPADPHCIELELPGFCASGQRFHFEMDTIGAASTVVMESADKGRLGWLQASTSMQAGGSRMLRICMPRGEVVRMRRGRHHRTSSYLYSSKLSVKLHGIGVSLVGSSAVDVAHKHKLGRSAEFVYAFLGDLGLSISTTPQHAELEPVSIQRVHLTVGAVQVDNYVQECVHPVMLRPTPAANPTPEAAAEEQQGTGSIVSGPTVLTVGYEAVDDGDPAHRIFKYMTVLLRPLTLELDGRSLHVILRLAQSMLQESGALSSALYWEHEPHQLVRSLQWNWQGASNARLGSGQRRIHQRKETGKAAPTRVLYFEVLHLQPMAFTLSFCPATKLALTTGTGDAAGSTTAEDTEQEDEINVGVEVLGMLQRAPVLTGVSIKLNALLLEHPAASPSHFGRIISAHYQKGVLSQLGTVVGSLAMLGNPVGLFGTISSGAYDFFHEPLEGLSTGISTGDASEVVAGFRKGTASLTSSTMSGILASAGGITGSVGAGVSMLAMDQRYADARAHRRAEERRRIFAEAARAGQASSMPIMHAASSSFFGGIYDGITGVVTSPVEEVMQADSVGEGAVGLVVGVGRGVAGVVIKPVVGIADAATSLFEGGQGFATHRVAPVAASHHRVIRAPRAIYGVHGLIRPYSVEAAEAYIALQSVGGGGVTDAFISHLKLRRRPADSSSEEGLLLLLTTKRCLLHGQWYIQWHNISTIRKLQDTTVSTVILEEETSNTKLRVRCYGGIDNGNRNPVDSAIAAGVAHDLLETVWTHSRDCNRRGDAEGGRFENKELESWHSNGGHGSSEDADTDIGGGSGAGEDAPTLGEQQTKVVRSKMERLVEFATGKKRELREAAARGDLGAVNSMLTSSVVDIESMDSRDGVTALHMACRGGHLAVVRALLRGGANVRAVHVGSMTPMQEAMFKNHEKVVLTLREWSEERHRGTSQQHHQQHQDRQDRQQRQQPLQHQPKARSRRKVRKIAVPSWVITNEVPKRTREARQKHALLVRCLGALCLVQYARVWAKWWLGILAVKTREAVSSEANSKHSDEEDPNHTTRTGMKADVSDGPVDAADFQITGDGATRKGARGHAVGAADAGDGAADDGGDVGDVDSNSIGASAAAAAAAKHAKIAAEIAMVHDFAAEFQSRVEAEEQHDNHIAMVHLAKARAHADGGSKILFLVHRSINHNCLIINGDAEKGCVILWLMFQKKGAPTEGLTFAERLLPAYNYKVTPVVEDVGEARPYWDWCLELNALTDRQLYISYRANTWTVRSRIDGVEGVRVLAVHVELKRTYFPTVDYIEIFGERGAYERKMM